MKILKWLVVLFVAVPLILVVGVYIRNKSIGPVGWAENNTLQKLKSRMKDPGSMTVRSSFVIKRPSPNGDIEIFVCGAVDAKNSLGAYTGGVPFASRSVSSPKFDTFDTYDIQVEDLEVKAAASRQNRLSAFEKVYWNAWCVDENHPALIPGR